MLQILQISLFNISAASDSEVAFLIRGRKRWKNNGLQVSRGSSTLQQAIKSEQIAYHLQIVQHDML